MPKTNRPAMRAHTIKCADPQWESVELEAAADGVSDSEVVRRALRHYFERGLRAAPDTQGER